MELQFDENMQTVRQFRPYINQEEGARSLIIYNPEGGPYYGLYTQNPYPLCTKQGHICHYENHETRDTKEFLTIYPHLKVYR